MPRRPSVEIENGFFHVTTRGAVGRPIFLDRFDYLGWLDRLRRAVAESRWRCFAYCAMPNHFHIVIQTPEPTRSAGMHYLNGSYARRFNVRYDEWGHVFQGRYGAKPIESDEHLLECCRYVVLNPVRAGLVAEPEDWPWSSHRATAGLPSVPTFFDESSVLGLFADETDRREGYRRFVAAGHVQGRGPETWLRHSLEA